MNRPFRLVLSAVLIASSVVLGIALISYAPDQITGASPVGTNLIGKAGAWIAHRLIGSWGLAAFYLPILIVGAGIALFSDQATLKLPRRLTGGILLVPAVAGLLHLLPITRLSERLLSHWDQHQLYGLGGSIGYWLCGPGHTDQDRDYVGGLMVRHVEVGGAAIILIAVVALCLIVMDIGFIDIARRAWKAFITYKPAGPVGKDRPIERSTAFSGPDTLAKTIPKARTTTAIQEISKRIDPDNGAIPPDAADLVERIRERKRALERQTSGGSLEAPPSSEPVEVPPGTTKVADAAPAPIPEPEPKTIPMPEQVVAAEPVTPPRERPRTKKPTKKPTEAESYDLPPVEILENVPSRRETENELEKSQTAGAIEEVFSHFEISVKVVAAQRGPVITMYEIQLLDPSMRVNKVEGFEKDLSLKLGTEGIRIVAPLPNKKTIGIEVPNRVKEHVVMRDLVEQIDVTTLTLPLILGRDVVGNPMIGDLSKMPHLLVAGATGTGKSVCMNAMICSILLFRGPEEVKFIMVDPKMVELAGYEDIPHLLTPPITEMTKAHAALEWACRTMDERYFALRMVGVRDIKAYNELGEAEIRNRLARKNKTIEDTPGMQIRMPYIIVLVDEYADLMMVNKEVEKSIIRLTQKSRAAGLHVILTTQRPSADVVTGLIKSNLPARICFRVADKSNSRVVLDAGGAENLLGRGDLLFLPPGSNALVRGQGVWVKDKEIEAIIEHAKAQGTPHYDETILSPGSIALVGGGGVGSGEGSLEWLADRQFHEAVQSMYRYNRSGADFFRRKLNIGYNKATSYVEQLEDLGFLGPQKGTSPREILKGWDQWIELLKSQGVNWEEDDELYHNPVEVRS